jgi:hypothetical protein
MQKKGSQKSKEKHQFFGQYLKDLPIQQAFSPTFGISQNLSSRHWFLSFLTVGLAVRALNFKASN